MIGLGDRKLSVSKISRLERMALELIKSRGSEGILQSELWKTLNLDSREGSRLVLRLAKKGLITRKPVMVNGRKTYRLLFNERSTVRPRIQLSLDSILDIPCATCPYMDQCDIGNYYDPRTCPWLERWLVRTSAIYREQRLRLSEVKA
ncbi:MAG: winged helix DNA-binding protein [Desulfurococcales archaeon]|nr:winged helix DNA-binding protein [Desulfurococcales archaeon]